MSGNDAVLAEVKRELRVCRAAARDGLSADQREELSSLVCTHAVAWMEKEDIASLMAYVPFRSELSTRPLISRAWEEGRRVLLPRVDPSSGEMAPHVVGSWNELAPGAYGIYEPIVSGEAPRDSSAGLTLPAAVFVPGLAFDLRGGRLGYGRGYYDRLRASWNSRLAAGAQPPVWVGVAFGLQLIPEVPMDEHDAYMDMLITENGIQHCRKGV